jgi:hypothetical protein
MKEFELKNVDPEDLSDLLVKVEKSLGIKFAANELMHITNFGELCDHIVNKIELDNTDNCTNQQAFYKLRSAISSTCKINTKEISTESELENILPRQSRRSQVKEIERQLGFKLRLLRPPHWITNTLLIVLFSSLVVLIFNRKVGFIGLLFFVAGLWLSDKLGNELDLQTAGELAPKMARENYLKSRRNAHTFNRKEIEKLLTDWFSNEFDLDKSTLTREAKFI